MAKVLKREDIYINIVTVDGHAFGAFKSHTHWSNLGSRRSLVELLWGIYRPETSIDIMTQNLHTMAVVEPE